MFWKPSNAIFHPLLVFLLAGDLGLQIFAGANVIDCVLGWSLPSVHTKGVFVCKQRLNPTGPFSYPRYCTSCGRPDNKSPSAIDCQGSRPLSTAGSFPCDAGITFDEPTNRARPISCRHTDPDGIPREYRCVRQHLPQQCPEKACNVQVE